MVEKYYLDTSIWIDYYEDRKDPNKDIGKYAYELLMKIMALKKKLIVSSVLLNELGGRFDYDQIRGMTIYFKKIIEIVNLTDEEKEEAIDISIRRGIPKCDVFHAVMARDHNAIMVARDNHFYRLRDICRVMRPEEII